MQIQHAFLACLPLLLQAAWAADAAPAAPRWGSRAEMRACLDQKDAVDAQGRSFNARIEAHNQQLAAIQTDMDALMAERSQLDSSRRADVDDWNRRLDAVNARVEQHNGQLDGNKRAQQSLEAAIQAHNQRCAALGTDQFTLDAMQRERANPKPPAEEVRAFQACNAMTSAWLSGDHERALSLVYPRLLQRLDKATVLALMRQPFGAKPPPDFRLVGMDCDMPVQASQAGGLRLLLLQVITSADTSKGRLLTPSYNLGISSDDGQSWTFLFVNADTPKQQADLKALLPAGLGGITLPAPRQSMMLPPRPGASSAGPHQPMALGNHSAICG